MKIKFLIFFLILMSFSGGCTAAAPAQTIEPTTLPAGENSQLPAIEPSATYTLSPSATPIPSVTPTTVPTRTAEPLLPTPTETPEPMAEFRFYSDVRQMPDANAAVVASFSQGIRLRAVNQDPGGQWIYVQVGPYTYGWAQQSAVTGSMLTGLPEATPQVTPTSESQPAGGLKCFLTLSYTESGKPRLFQIYIQGLTPVNPYTMKLFTPKNSLVLAWDFKPRADGTFYKEHSADKAAPGAYKLEINFAGEPVTSCTGNLVQK